VHPELPSRGEVARFLEDRLKELVAEDHLPDALTYAGNGEPTLHPEFPGIVEDTLVLRDRYAPLAKVTVLSNSSMTGDPAVFNALKRLDNNILKLDCGSERLFRLINDPVIPVGFHELIGNLNKFEGDLIIQTMFLRGRFRGEEIDNTTPEEVAAWLEHLKSIRPKLVMIYPIARATPVHNLEKVPAAELELIAAKVRAAGLNVQVYQ
jgi:wyosine [tRNA(Phe)-imidazoG37] synthetase (radical SAM superfamily)